MVRKLERKLAGTGEKGEEDKDVLLNQEAEIERLKKKALDAMASEEVCVCAALVGSAYCVECF